MTISHSTTPSSPVPDYQMPSLHRTTSEGELTAYSSVSSVRNAIASARKTRESLRQSRASIQSLREESRQALRESKELRAALQAVLGDRRTSRGLSPERETESHDGSSVSDISEVTLELE